MTMIEHKLRGLLKFESRVSSIKNVRIRCFLLIQLKLETQVLILETRYSVEDNTHKLHNTTFYHSADTVTPAEAWRLLSVLLAC